MWDVERAKTRQPERLPRRSRQCVVTGLVGDSDLGWGDHLGVNRDGDLVADQPAARFQGDIPLQPEVFTAEGGCGGEAVAILALHILDLAFDGHVKGDRLRNPTNRQVTRDAQTILPDFLNSGAVESGGWMILDIEEI